MKQFSKEEIQRQDFVDNQIFKLLQSLLPHPEMIEWDIETIGIVRDCAEEQLVRNKKLINAEQFYP